MSKRTNLKNWLVVVFLFVVSPWACQSAYGQPWDGSGTAEDPYQIWTAADMQAIGASSGYWGAHFRLMANIDLSAYTGTSFFIIGSSARPFTGVFDGNGHTISNFTYSSSGTDYIGLFGCVGSWAGDGEIKDLGLVEPNVGAGTGDYVGSLVGSLEDGIIRWCYAERGSVSGGKYVGGLVGRSSRWEGETGTITDCYCTSSVGGDSVVGGLVGSVGAPVIRCYSSGIVSGSSFVGGLAGENNWAVFGSYWDSEASEAGTSAGGVGKTTAEMQTASTFVGWKCGSGWTIDEGNDYPRLWWQNEPGVAITNPSYGGGNGMESDPYLIYTAEQLNSIGLVLCDSDAHFKLMADIDLSGYTGDEFNLIGYWASYYDSNPFTGVFDGDGHTIWNFTYDSNGGDYVGLFGYAGNWRTGEYAEIRNVRLADPNVNGGEGKCVGSLIGNIDGGSVSQCCCEGGSVLGGNEVGGLIGGNDASVSESYAWAEVTGTNKTGGLIGSNYFGEVSNCYSYSAVIGSKWTGGFMGLNAADSFSGGFITNCYSTGSVSGTDHVGGFVGEDRGRIVSCYWDVETSGEPNSDGGYGKTSEEMKAASTFVGWGCDSVWTIVDGNDYPRLSWEDRPGEFIANPLYGGGSGGAGDPYLIYSAEQLNAIGLVYCDWDKQFKLMDDIDLTGIDFHIIGHSYGWQYSWIRNHTFSGVFDGNGKTISGFNYRSGALRANCVGIFSHIDGQGAEVKDLRLIDPDIVADNGIYIGSLAGYVSGGTISGCWAEGGKVWGSTWIGGLVGYNYGTISHSYAGSDVRGSALYADIGGLIGRNSGEIYYSHADGVVTGGGHAGGLAGHNSGTISECYSSAVVSGGTSIGGLVGYNWGGEGAVTISNSYSSGGVLGNDRVGGLVGYSYKGNIHDCYSTGSVSGTTAVGGLVGWKRLGTTVADCFWDVNSSGQSGSYGGTGKTTAEMQDPNTFLDAGWDFIGEANNGVDDVWTLCESPDYPRLWWECPPPVEAEIKLMPDTLNLQSKGRWIMCLIRLPEDYNVADIDPNAVFLEDEIPADRLVLEGEPAMAKFSRQALQQILADLDTPAEAELLVTGQLTDGTIFEGTDTITVINKPGKPE